ncbi:T9SS type A sorting domain-containing protein [Rufibacter radiotolerans]|uniref:T9SS type A sorting domain-containing protein n=1 Tax=Rufibacter radiotolerans TaxID=1379910 RepID=UPI0009E43B86|nr:T9SS type A sorting domain-containing protein [Rufibacter radiotolerans]
MKNLYSSCKVLVLVVCLLSLQMVANAQVDLPLTGSYTQNFDALPASGVSANWSDGVTLQGWYARMDTAIPATIVGMTTQSGKLSGSGTNTFACLDINTDKAIGFRAKGGTTTYGVRFKNNTTKDITGLSLNFLIKAIFTKSNPTPQTLTLSYAIGKDLTNPENTALSWTSINNSNGTTAFVLAQPNISTSISNFKLLVGQELFIRVVDAHTNSSGNEDDLAIDNFTVSVTGSSTPVPLPVTLTSFSAKRAGDVVNLAWATASEKDNDYFEVQQSEDGKAFQAVGERVKGHGTTSVVQSYKAAVTAAATKTLYFRLKQVDFDGKFEYSKVIAVKAADTKTSVKTALEVYPNPTTSKVTVNITETTGTAAVTLFHSSGRVVLKQEVQLAAGKGIELDLAGQHAGIYYLQVQTATSKATTRIVKK